MLIIVSDLHLTDDPYSTNVKEGAFRVFRERLSDLAYDASWRDGDKYDPIQQLDVLLLGDILDPIRSPKWPGTKPKDKDYVRPWSDRSSVEARFPEVISDITESILLNNKGSLGILKKLGKDGTTIPKAKDGKPIPASYAADLRKTVKVQIHYMVGNHDWFYHLAGPAYDNIRSKVIEEMGLAHTSPSPFPHRPDESDVVSKVLDDHGVYAQHGDIYDGFNYNADLTRDASSLGDVIVVELINHFPEAVKKEPNLQLPQSCIEGLKEIDNVRPVTLSSLCGYKVS